MYSNIYAVSELVECGWSEKDDYGLSRYHRFRCLDREIEIGAKRLAEVVQNKSKRLLSKN